VQVQVQELVLEQAQAQAQAQVWTWVASLKLVEVSPKDTCQLKSAREFQKLS
jgi:hypothetical protein